MVSIALKAYRRLSERNGPVCFSQLVSKGLSFNSARKAIVELEEMGLAKISRMGRITSVELMRNG